LRLRKIEFTAANAVLFLQLYRAHVAGAATQREIGKNQLARFLRRPLFFVKPGELCIFAKQKPVCGRIHFGFTHAENFPSHPPYQDHSSSPQRADFIPRARDGLFARVTRLSPHHFAVGRRLRKKHWGMFVTGLKPFLAS